MTKDLEETLRELGPGYRGVVDRLTGAFQPLAEPLAEPLADAASANRGHIFRWTASYLVAASLLVFVGLGVIFRPGGPCAPSASGRASRGVSEAKLVYTVAYAADEASLRAIVASQRADGSWSNDFITRQNAAALRGATDALSLVAYKRAVRYLKSRGLAPLTDGELKARGDRAARLLDENC